MSNTTYFRFHAVPTWYVIYLLTKSSAWYLTGKFINDLPRKHNKCINMPNDFILAAELIEKFKFTASVSYIVCLTNWKDINSLGFQDLLDI